MTNTSSGTTVDLGPDIEILVGESVLLTASLDIDSSSLTGISWEPEVPCQDCLSNTVENVLETQLFQILVSDPFGCVAKDDVWVFVVERAQIYIPNIFSPNGDGVNDLLAISAHQGVALINRLEIFDRWGNMVFAAYDFLPDDPAGWWDGTASGREVNPGVYVYTIDLQLVTGRNERRSGDLTVIR